MQPYSNQEIRNELAKKSRSAWEKMPTIFCLFVLGVFGSGCSVHMWREGWALHSTTLDVSGMTGYRRPVAIKNANGDVLFEYDVHATQYGITGRLNDNERELGLRRITNTVPQMALQAITNIWPVIDPNGILPSKKIYPSANSTNAFIQAKQNLPILGCKKEPDGSWKFPSSECVVWDNEYLWYVPPLHTNDVPMAAVLSTETIHTPIYLYPVKVVLFPIFLIGDFYYVPVMYFFDR